MFSKFYYKRKLKSYKASRQVNRGFLNIRDMKHLVVAIECDDFSNVREVEKEIKPLLKSIPKVSYVIFLNDKRLEEFASVVSAQNVLLFKEDIVRKLTPNVEVIERIDDLKPDVFVNLNRKPSAVIDFLSAISKAKMRVSFEEKKDLADLLLAVPSDKGFKAFFDKLLQVMGQINGNAA